MFFAAFLVLFSSCEKTPKTKELFSGGFSFDFSFNLSESSFVGTLSKDVGGCYEITLKKPYSVERLSFVYLSGNMTVIYDGLDRFEAGTPPENSVVGVLCLPFEKAEKTGSVSGENYKITIENNIPIKLSSNGILVEIENFSKK